MKNNKSGSRGNTSEAGERFLRAVLNWGDSRKAFYIELSKALENTSPDTIESKITDFINGHEKFPAKYIYATEKILRIRIADIIDGTNAYLSSPRGLYEIGTQGGYNDFEWLAKQTDGSIEVIKSYDEWSKGIVDYVYEAKNLEGLKYLIEHGFYETFAPGKFFTNYCINKINDEDHALLLLDILSKDDDPDGKAFASLFDTRKHTDLIQIDGSIFQNEEILKKLLENEKLLKPIANRLDIVPESELNGPKRQTPNDYMAICASNWLTPLLCYALNHENKYLDQAILLGTKSLEIATKALTSIRNNIDLLGGYEESIRTENGHIILGHQHVIGVIGEPQTKGVIKNKELKDLVDRITSTIGSFRSLAKIMTPTIVNGKMHLPRADHNKDYRPFITASKGQKYLLQESDSNDLDTHNYVFDAPKGKEASRNLSLKQWNQIGKALYSIHQIKTSQEGKAFCHGRFYFSDIYLTNKGDVELIAGYHNVYIGNPEDDLYEMACLAFKTDFVSVQTNQDAIEAFLDGYGYPKEGFLDKLWDYLVLCVKKENNPNEAQYLMQLALSVLRVAKKKE